MSGLRIERPVGERGPARVRELCAERVETVVLASNVDGLRFATARGFTEFERYTMPGEDVEWVTLRLEPGLP